MLLQARLGEIDSSGARVETVTEAQITDLVGTDGGTTSIQKYTADGKLKVFISYSRRDMQFADRLVAALEIRGLNVLIDRRDLPLLEDWERELIGFVRQSDTVVFVVSPHSIASRVCTWEIEQVRLHSKRLAPVVIAEIQGVEVPPEISRISYLFFTDDRLFEQRADELAQALNTDVRWLKEHTRLGEIARRWEEHSGPEDELIRGRDLDDADAWAARRPRDAPIVTPLQQRFLAASRKAQSERLERERRTVARTRRLQRIAAWTLSSIAILVTIVLVGALWQARENEKRQARVLTSLAQKAIDGSYYERAMRIALLGLPLVGKAPWLPGWSTPEISGLEAKLSGAAQLSPLQFELTGHGGVVWSVGFDPSGTRIATASGDKALRIWDATSGALVRTLTGHTEMVRAAVFSPDGTRIVTASNDNSARVWDAASGAELLRLTGHTGWVRAVAFSPDGTRIVTGSQDNTARVWDAKSGMQLLKLEGHDRPISAVAFSPDGLQIATASEDSTARVWEAKSGAQLRKLAAHANWVCSLAFSPDGARLATGSYDNTARIFDSEFGRSTP